MISALEPMSESERRVLHPLPPVTKGGKLKNGVESVSDFILSQSEDGTAHVTV